MYLNILILILLVNVINYCVSQKYINKYNCRDCNCDIPYNNSHYRREVSNCIWMPDEYGSLRMVNLMGQSAPLRATRLEQIKITYVTRYTSGTLNFEDKSLEDFKMELLSFIPEKAAARPLRGLAGVIFELVVIIGWFTISASTVSPVLLTEESVKKSGVSAVITVSLPPSVDYRNTVKHTEHNSKVVARFLKKLDKVLDGANYYLIGLGEEAHAVTLISRELGGVHTIIALDPMNPIWYKRIDQLLRVTDAGCVIDFITDAYILGLPDPLGTTNIYFYSGKHPQPGCATSVCSHLRALHYFMVLITDFVEIQECGDYKEALTGECTGPKKNFTLFDECPKGSFIAKVTSEQILHALRN